MSDKQLQREFVWRDRFMPVRGESREVVLPAPPDVQSRAQNGDPHRSRIHGSHVCKRRHRSLVHLQTRK
jgi:hypothetical protein